VWLYVRRRLNKGVKTKKKGNDMKDKLSNDIAREDFIFWKEQQDTKPRNSFLCFREATAMCSRCLEYFYKEELQDGMCEGCAKTTNYNKSIGRM